MLDKIFSIFTKYEAKGIGYCPLCGEELKEGAKQYNISGALITMDPECVNKVNEFIEAVNKDFKEAPNNYLKVAIVDVIGALVVAIAFKWLYAQQGILNYFIELLGFNPIGWLTDTMFALFSVALVTIYKGIGYYMMIYLSSLIGVPKDLYEAADVDGASEFKKHLTVTIPHIMPTIALVVTISSISALKVFAEIYVMTKGGPLNSTKTIVYYIYERAFENLDLSMAATASVVLLAVILIFSIINITFFEGKRYKL